MIISFPDTDADECASDPCYNNATCVDQVNDVMCICDEGFTGLFCETGNYYHAIYTEFLDVSRYRL